MQPQSHLPVKGGIFPRDIEKAAGEVDYITIRLASEAMEASINFHTWISVIVKRTLTHTVPAYL
jgi:hypothetical protein